MRFRDRRPTRTANRGGSAFHVLRRRSRVWPQQPVADLIRTPARPQRREASPVRHQHSQDLTDDGGRPARPFGASPRGGVSVCRYPLPFPAAQASFRDEVPGGPVGSITRAARRQMHPNQRAATSPMGFSASRRNQPRRSLARRLASPAPSAPRVSHPLSGFIPSRPRGSISRHIHPQAFGPPELLPLSQPLRLSTPSALVPSRSRLPPHRSVNASRGAATSELSSG